MLRSCLWFLDPCGRMTSDHVRRLFDCKATSNNGADPKYQHASRKSFKIVPTQAQDPLPSARAVSPRQTGLRDSAFSCRDICQRMFLAPSPALQKSYIPIYSDSFLAQKNPWQRV